MTDGQQIDMTPLDYGRSFLIGKGAANEVRFWIESRTRILDDREGVCEDFYQTASCKSENTFGEKDLFQADNYDFLPIFSARHGLIFRRHAYLSDRYRQTLPYGKMFGGYDLHLVEGSKVRELPSNAAVREETYRFAPLVSQTEIGDDSTGLRGPDRMSGEDDEHPPRGRHLPGRHWSARFPDLSERPERLVDCLALAFVAFNVPHFADFVIEAPTVIDAEHPDLQVRHFSEIVSLPARNRLFAVE